MAHVTSALSAHRIVYDIENALKNKRLLQITQVESLLSCNVEQNYPPVQCSRPNIEMDLAIAHAALIAEHVCICCDRLHQRKSVSSL